MLCSASMRLTRVRSQHGCTSVTGSMFPRSSRAVCVEYCIPVGESNGLIPVRRVGIAIVQFFGSGCSVVIKH